MSMRTCAALCLLGLLTGCAASVRAPVAGAASSAHAQLAILETTDIHSHVLGYDYDRLATDPHVGLDRVATLIEQARTQFPNTLLIDDGDTIQGTALADYQALAKPVACDQELAVYRAMDLLHYDAGTLGNHEFNYGLPFLSQVTGIPMHLPGVPVEHCDGPHYPLVLSNVVRASDGAPVFKPWLVLQRTLTATDAHGKVIRAPTRIGLLGFTPPPIMQWDHAHLYGKVKTLGVVEAAEKYLPALRAQHVDLVIAVSHGGLDLSPYSSRLENADWYLADIPGIDVLLMGHSHDIFPNPGDPKSRFAHLRNVDNVRGFVRGKPAVMGGFFGHDLGVIDLALVRRDGDWAIDQADTYSEVRPICKSKDDCVAPDPRIVQAVQTAHQATIQYVQTPIGATDFRISSYFADAGDTSVAAVINAAQINYVQRHLYDTHPELRGLPLLSSASAFKTGFAGPDDYTDIEPGPLSLRSAADLYAYPNTLTVVKLSGAGVKAWLEKSAQYFNRIDPRAMQPQELINRKMPSYNFDVIEGERDDNFSYAIDVSKPVGARIVDMRMRDRPLDPRQPFLIVTNNYRAEGGGHFPGLDGHATVWAAPDTNRQAVIDFVRAAKTLHRGAFDLRPWRFAPLSTSAPIIFACAVDKLAIARAAGLENVRQLRDHGDGTAACALTLTH